MRAKIRIVVIALVLLLGAGSAYWWFQRSHSQDGSLLLYGNVDIREVELAFRQPGRLLTMAVEEGAKVKAGDVLAELDAQPYRDSLAAAEAQVRQAQAEFGKLKRGNRPQEVKRAEEGVRQAEAVLSKAEADFERQRGLAATGAASQKMLESARSGRDEAAAALAAAKQSLSLQREGFRQEDIAVAEARLAVAEASLAQAQTALEDTRLVAPADATVLSRVREPGSMVASRDPVYVLSLYNPVYVRAYVSEPNLGRLAPGSRVQVTTDSSSRVYEGHVGFVSPKAEFTPKSVETTSLRTDLVYRLRIVVTDGDEGLRQGMPVTVRVGGNENANENAHANTSTDANPHTNTSTTVNTNLSAPATPKE